MKKFKKWWRSDNRQMTMCADIAAEIAWKAALEWVLKELNEQFEHSCHGDSGYQGKFVLKECLVGF